MHRDYFSGLTAAEIQPVKIPNGYFGVKGSDAYNLFTEMVLQRGGSEKSDSNYDLADDSILIDDNRIMNTTSLGFIMGSIYLLGEFAVEEYWIGGRNKTPIEKKQFGVWDQGRFKGVDVGLLYYVADLPGEDWAAHRRHALEKTAPHLLNRFFGGELKDDFLLRKP